MAASPPNDSAARAEALARQGHIAEAFRLLESAIDRGDAEAAFTLADWRMTGALIRRDLAEARRLYGRAAELGLGEAAPVHIAMLANGAGGVGRDWKAALRLLATRAVRDPAARMQTELLAAMTLDDAGNPLTPSWQRELLHDQPRIERLPGFLKPEECAYLARLALPRLAPSVVFDPDSGRQMRDPVRTALGASFPFVHEDPVIHAINRRIAAATGTSCEQGEPLQVLSYKSGQEYKLHSDALPQTDNQRVATFLVKLNDGFEGGETEFPRLGLTLSGHRGDALYFVNINAEGRPEPSLWHAGLPVTRGRKLLLSKWIRAMPLDLAGPPGRPF